MNPNLKRQLRIGSRDWRTLAKLGGGIVAVGLALAVLIEVVREKEVDPIRMARIMMQKVVGEGMEEVFEEELEKLAEATETLTSSPSTADEIATHLRHYATSAWNEEEVLPLMESLKAEGPSGDAIDWDSLELYGRGLFSSEDQLKKEAASNLLSIAGDSSAASLTRSMAADLLWHAGDIEGAGKILHTFATGGNESEFALERAATFALHQKDRELAASLLDGPHEENLEPAIQTMLSRLDRRWLRSTADSFLGHLSLLTPVIALLVTLAGGIWFWILHYFAQDRTLRGLPIFVIAFLLGIASIIPTTFMITYQEDVRGLVRSADLGQDMLYWFLGVALREELSKLLLFLPLIPWLRKRGSLADVVVAGGAVGLGFAVFENISYLSRWEPGVWGRFLNANFFHMALTGLVCTSLFKALCVPKGRVENFLIDLFLVIAAHGAYNLFMSRPELSGESALAGAGSLVVFAIIAYRFFQVLDLHAPSRQDTIHPLGIFIAGACLLIAVTLNVAMWDLPLRFGLGSFGKEILSTGLITAIFINQFRDNA